MKSPILSGVVLLLLASAAHAGLPPRGPAPLLFVRFAGPAGMRVTLYQGGAGGRELAAPATVGLRPGYCYRVKITGLPEHPGLALYPTLEVRGSLQLPPPQNACNHPAPVTFDTADVERVLSGALLTKVIYLEHPDRAVPVATQPDVPLQQEVSPDRDPVEVARTLGRPVLVVRLGEREVSPEELAQQTVPGTVLFPGDKVLGPAAAPPCVPFACLPVIDPIAGPRHPEEECLHDGGDIGPRAGLDRDGRLQGLDPSDTVAEYRDSHGRRRISVSNRICLCVPRFAVILKVLPLARYDSVVEVGAANQVVSQVLVKKNLPSLMAQRNEQLLGMNGRLRPTGTVTTLGADQLVGLKLLVASVIYIGPAELLATQQAQQLTEVQRTLLLRQLTLARELSQPTGPAEVEQVVKTSVAGRVKGLDVITAVAETRDLTCVCGEPPHPPEKPLVLCKWAGATCAKIGDVVTFYLKYSNHGGQPITDVAVSDSLTARLEYVPGSARSDRDAVFTVQQNEAGSVVLRWEVSGRLLPGQSGVVTFQAKVR